MTFFLSGVGLVQAQKQTLLDELSYTEDQTWFHQKRGWSEVTQSQQRQPWRQATWEERVHHFITALRKGDRKAFLFVEYPLLDGYFSSQGYPIEPSIANERVGDRGNGRTASLGVIWKIYFEARKNNTTAMKWLTNGDPKVRESVIRATLSGLFNKDPRVRLVAVNFLRRLRPEASMARDVKRAIILETVTSERSKWREKDIDIPSIEQPRLGWGAVAWSTGIRKPYSIAARYRDGLDEGISELLNGNGKGDYLVNGLYRKTERNDYPTEYTDINHTTGATSTRRVWTKASLLRYGADEHVSGFETEYGYAKAVEYMPKYVYSYIDFRDPESDKAVETAYTAYHSVWEEMKKLDLFISRAIWTEKVKKGDLYALKYISKDTFRTLADQIDGESLDLVPFKSPSFKIFAEAEARGIIVGMLENRVVSTREECARFLKRLFDYQATSIAIKREIKKALREARRRELAIDTIRGRHLHGELVIPRQSDDWWGERDEIDTSGYTDAERGEKLQRYRNQVEFPEETDIIFHDRRKPGQAPADSSKPATTTTTTTSKPAGDIITPSDARIGHPLLLKSTATYEDVEYYFQLDNFLGGELGKTAAVKPATTTTSTTSTTTTPKTSTTTTTPATSTTTTTPKTSTTTTTTPATTETKPSDDWQFADGIQSELGDRLRPGQTPGENKEPMGVIPTDVNKRSVTARYYERVRAVETLHSLMIGDGNALLKASYLDVQNALLLWMALINRDRAGATNVIEDDFLWYLLAGASSISGTEGTRFHSHKELDLELARGDRARASLIKLWEGTKASLGYQLQKGNLVEDEKKTKRL